MTPVGRFIALVGAVGIIVGAFLPWAAAGTIAEVVPMDVRSQWVFGFSGSPTTDIWLEALVFPLVVGGVLVAAGALVRSSAVTLIGALVSGAGVVGWVIRESSVRSGDVLDFADRWGPGVIAVALGVLVALVAALFLRAPRNAPALASN